MHPIYEIAHRVLARFDFGRAYEMLKWKWQLADRYDRPTLEEFQALAFSLLWEMVKSAESAPNRPCHAVSSGGFQWLAFKWSEKGDWQVKLIFGESCSEN